MKKALTAKQLIIVGIVIWGIAKFPIEILLGTNLGDIVGIALELGGVFAVIVGIIKWLKTRNKNL